MDGLVQTRERFLLMGDLHWTSVKRLGPSRSGSVKRIRDQPLGREGTVLTPGFPPAAGLA